MADWQSEKMKELYQEAKRRGLENTTFFFVQCLRLKAEFSWPIYDYTMNVLRYSVWVPTLETTFPVPVKQEDLIAVDGPYKLGNFSHSDIEFGLTDRQINEHVGIFGRTGSGKSTIVNILASQIIEKGDAKILLIDPKGKSDYRGLCRYPDVVLLTPEVLRLNPFSEIPGVSRKMLKSALSDVTADSYIVLEPSEAYLMRHIKLVLEEYDKPTIYNFFKSIRSEEGGGFKKQNYLETIEPRLMFTEDGLGEILNCKEDYFSLLYDKHIVIETHGLTAFAQKLIVNYLMMKFYLYNMRNPGNGRRGRCRLCA